MNKKFRAIAVITAASCLLVISNLNSPKTSAAKIPSPKLVFYGTQDSANGSNQMMTIYWLGIENRNEFPDKMFEPSPKLPPCGKNANASRSWIFIYDSTNKPLYSFCAIKSSAELNKISFSLQKDQIPPEYVYAVILDRKTGKRYSSELLPIKKTLK